MPGFGFGLSPLKVTGFWIKWSLRLIQFDKKFLKTLGLNCSMWKIIGMNTCFVEELSIYNIVYYRRSRHTVFLHAILSVKWFSLLLPVKFYQQIIKLKLQNYAMNNMTFRSMTDCSMCIANRRAALRSHDRHINHTGTKADDVRLVL